MNSSLVVSAVCFDGSAVPISVTASTTAADAKQQIADEVGFSPSHFYLTFEGSELEDPTTVVSLGVSDGDTLDMERSSKARALHRLGSIEPTTANLVRDIKSFGQLTPTFIEAETELNKLSDHLTPLMAACGVGNIEAASHLISGGADLHCRDNEGCVALMYAACEDRVECLNLLIENGADVHKKDKDGWTALMHCAKMEGTDCLKSLLSEGSDDRARDNSGWTPLIHAAAEGSSDAVRMLLEHGSDVNAVCNNGLSPLMYCCDLTVSNSF
eukprot:TRINITY_DN6965_c0_g1_i1.p1 TRINITY_DN6965_c0_g1~~TRINITY_DN6965_c0_g1_i1.p1  ORF type:complete len:271 (+),score=57.57 TRINITY_DN6965_c0_g1_i1:78-890(+)